MTDWTQFHPTQSMTTPEGVTFPWKRIARAAALLSRLENRP